MKNEKEYHNINLIKRISKELFKPYIIVILIFTCFIITTVLATITPKMVGQIMTEIYEQLINKIAVNGVMEFGRINSLLMGLATIYIIYSILGYIKNILLINICQTYIANLREKFNDKILKLPIKYFNEKNNGEILSVLTNDVENINTNLIRVIREVFTESLNIIGACIMMYTISPKLISINIVIIMISMIIIITLSKVSKKYFIDKQKRIGDLNSSIEEMYSAHSTVKMFNQVEYMQEKFNDENSKLRKISIKSEFIASIAGSVLKFLENVAVAAIAIASAILNIKGELEIGYIYTIISYTKTMTNPLSRIGFIINEFMNIIASAKRVYQFIDEDESVKNRQTKSTDNFKNKLVADSIWFGYEKGKDIIKDMNVLIPKGKKIAIVGRTGSGKTTLVKLLMNIYSVDKGKIEIDDTNINKLNEEEYLKNFSVISQDINLFTDTVMENIKYGNPQITDEEVVDIAKKIDIHDIILELENGYNTFLTENNNISYGIKQLIVLMQNIVSTSSVLVMDEATNMLDEKIEEKIEKAMNYIRKDKTLIVIAHKLQTIKDSDCIYVIDEGKIIESGTHEELIANKNIYAKMYQKS